MERKWLSVEFTKDEATSFKAELDSVGIKYESSECFNLIHFEVFVNKEEQAFIDTYLDIKEYDSK